MPDVKGASRPAAAPKPSRRDRANATRLRIIEAAQQEFTTNGYQATTMSAIAARADVAVQTVHFVFHTKSELLGALVDHAVLGGPDPTPPQDAVWMRALPGDLSARDALAAFIRGSGPIFERAGALNEVAREASRLDPEARRVFDRLEELRVEAYRSFLDRVGSAGGEPAGFDLDQATDALVVLYSPRTFLSLTQDRGWSPQRAIDWLAATVPTAVLGERPPA